MQFPRESYMIPVTDADQLRLERFCGNGNGIPVLMVHGSVENGKIFHSSSGKGLAPFLASCGYDVFVADLRGKGKSIPHVGRQSAYGQYEAITEDLPAIIAKIRSLKPDQHMHLAAHSWGGVLLLCWYARFHGSAGIRSMIFFGVKRRIGIFSPERLFMVDLMWSFTGTVATWVKGYLPAKKLRFGSDNEPARFYREINRWVYSKSWKDRRDGFDYHEALRNLRLPPLLSLSGTNDRVLGHPEDAKRLLNETGAADATFIEAGKINGFLHDYGHIDLLTHPDAPADHFPQIVRWMKEKENHGQKS